MIHQILGLDLIVNCLLGGLGGLGGSIVFYIFGTLASLRFNSCSCSSSVSFVSFVVQDFLSSSTNAHAAALSKHAGQPA